MAVELVPEWMAGLEEEDLVFIKKICAVLRLPQRGGGQYGVTYPTVRLRLDRLIQKIKLGGGQGGRPLHCPDQASGGK